MKHMITSALILGATLLTAQEQKTREETKGTTVRIKKVENVNGVEKITDTTYTTNGPMTLEVIDELTKEEGKIRKEGEPKKIVIITDEVNGDNVKVTNLDEVIDEQVERALKTACKDGKTVEKVMTVNVDAKDGKDGDKQITKIVILKTVRIEDPTAADSKMISKQTGISDGKLAMDNMKFYPNPSTGKFNLDFNLPAKGTTEVTILNMEGKEIYREELKDFSGQYKKEIDISENPKGAYFVRVKQGAHAQLKKIVLE